MVRKEYKGFGRDRLFSTLLPGIGITAIFIITHLILITIDTPWDNIPWKFLILGIVGLLFISKGLFKNQSDISREKIAGYYKKLGLIFLSFIIILIILSHLISGIMLDTPQNFLLEIKFFYFSLLLLNSVIALFYLTIHHTSGGCIGLNKGDILGYASPLMIPLFTFFAHFEYVRMMWIPIVDGSMFKVYLLMTAAVIFCIISTLNSYRILKEEDT